MISLFYMVFTIKVIVALPWPLCPFFLSELYVDIVTLAVSNGVVFVSNQI
jgi:hypothetical protein